MEEPMEFMYSKAKEQVYDKTKNYNKLEKWW